MRQLLSKREAAEFLDLQLATCNLQPATLRHWRVQDREPVYYRIGGAIRYYHTDLKSFLDNCRDGEGLGR
jgi:hypothetical protein